MRFWTQDAIPMLVMVSIFISLVGAVADRLPRRRRHESQSDDAVRSRRPEDG